MNLELLRQKLTQAARAGAKDDSVPYGFEHRIMASIRSHGDLCLGVRVEWAGGLWRAAISCVGLVVVLMTCSLTFPGEQSGVEDLGVALENAILAAADEALEAL